MTILIILIAPIAGKTTDRVGSRALMTVGMLLVAAQLLYFSRLTADASFWNLLPGFLVGGAGMAMTMTPSAAAATRAVPVDNAGVGAAVLNAFRQVGGSLGIALMGAIMAREAAGRRTVDAFMDGFQRSLLVAAFIALAGAIVAFALVRPHELEEEASHARSARASGLRHQPVHDALRPKAGCAGREAKHGSAVPHAKKGADGGNMVSPVM